jgi:tRNA/tmRNA/rRNA uracil-C5-methylase (TrmA/RlmC/RlmD family)
VVQGAVQTQDLLSIGLTGVALDGRTLAGEPWIEIEVAGISHRLGPLTFFQVNAEVNALLVRRVRDWVLSRHPTQVLDLFSGAGNLSLPLAKAQVPLVALESNPRAIDDLRATAARHDLQVDARVTDARDVRAGQFFFDVAILDPPRKGAGRLLEQLVLTRPTAIAYLSCNPRALARELPLALDAGYRIAALELFEMFPHTHHTEVLCLLERDRT